MNNYSLQLLVIFICYLKTLAFMGISCFSCFVYLDDRIILSSTPLLYTTVGLQSRYYQFFYYYAQCRIKSWA